VIETTLVCRHTATRQAVPNPDALPGTWLHVDTIRTTDGAETDLHFASWDALASWAAAQAALRRIPAPVPFLDRHRAAS
jgi:hypothetical protein